MRPNNNRTVQSEFELFKQIGMIGVVTLFITLVQITFYILVSKKIIQPEDYLFLSKNQTFGQFYRLFTGVFIEQAYYSWYFICLPISSLFDLERKTFSNRRSNLIFVLILFFLFTDFFSLFLPCSQNIVFYLSITVFASKLFSDMRVHVIFFDITLQFVPFFFMITDIVFSGKYSRILDYFLAILVGSLVFYLLYILPVITGRALLKTPHILTVLFD